MTAYVQPGYWQSGYAVGDGVPGGAHVGAGSASLEDLVVSGVGRHGVSGVGVAHLDWPAADGHGVHVRYELRGQVRLDGVLMNRRVRAYLRDSGALIAEADTVAGRFRLPVGFAPAEYYVIPIDLSPLAADFSPPCANRVVSVLAAD